jgi:hypothetical protein
MAMRMVSALAERKRYSDGDVMVLSERLKGHLGCITSPLHVVTLTVACGSGAMESSARTRPATPLLSATGYDRFTLNDSTSTASIARLRP